jgi:N-carbamoylputrescine amidase
LKLTVCAMPDDREEFAVTWPRLARHVKRESSDLVLLNEMPFTHWIFAGPKFEVKAWKQAVDSHRRWAGRLSELESHFVAGSRTLERKGRRVNEGFVWSEEGGMKGNHEKRYLPDEPGFYEASWYERGDGRFTPFGLGGWKAGFMICSDLWAMGHARSYGKKGVDLILVPRATGLSVEKWLAGGKVAAVVAGAYCASSNRTGVQGEARFGGLGWVVDPDGKVLATTSRSKPFVTVEIDRGAAKKAKGTYPRYALRPD